MRKFILAVLLCIAALAPARPQTQFNPGNWYWCVAGCAVNVWWSATRAYVPLADAGYTQFLADGNVAASAPDEGSMLNSLRTGNPLFTDFTNKALQPSITVRLVSAANVNLAADLAAGNTLDGKTLVMGDIVLVVGQTTQADNGLYLITSAAAVRWSAGFPQYAYFVGLIITISEGTTYANSVWECTSTGTGTIGTTALTFALQQYPFSIISVSDAVVDLTLSNPTPNAVRYSTQTVGRTITLPAANAVNSPPVGFSITIYIETVGISPQAVSIQNNGGGPLGTYNPNDVVRLVLFDKSTAAGTWRQVVNGTISQYDVDPTGITTGLVRYNTATNLFYTIPMANNGLFGVGDIIYAPTTTTLTTRAVGISGTLVQGGTAPSYCAACTLNTSLTVPVMFGGTAVASSATISSTSNAAPTNDFINFFTNGVERARIISSGNVGIGTTTPPSNSKLVVSSNSTQLPNPVAVTLLHLGGADGVNPAVTYEAFGATPIFGFLRSDGTAASRSALASGVNIGLLSWSGFNGAVATGAKGRMRAITSEAWTTAANGTEVIVDVTPKGSATIGETVRFRDTGGLSIASTALTVSSGEVGMARGSVAGSGTSPGANGGKLAVICSGTVSGAAALVMYAGTSTVYKTIIDNVGSGVTGC